MLADQATFTVYFIMMDMLKRAAKKYSKIIVAKSRMTIASGKIIKYFCKTYLFI